MTDPPTARLVRSGRVSNDPAFLERTTERRRVLLGDFSTSYGSFHGAGPVPKL